jgi:prephenate dehydrogenase
MRAQTKVVSVVGLVPVGQAIADALQNKGFRVRVIAARQDKNHGWFQTDCLRPGL